MTLGIYIKDIVGSLKVNLDMLTITWALSIFYTSKTESEKKNVHVLAGSLLLKDDGNLEILSSS